VRSAPTQTEIIEDARVGRLLDDVSANIATDDLGPLGRLVQFDAIRVVRQGAATISRKRERREAFWSTRWWRAASVLKIPVAPGPTGSMLFT